MAEDKKDKNWSGKRLTVIGAGVSGMALAFLARGLGARVFISEEKAELPYDAAKRLEKIGVGWEAGGHSPRAFEADALLLSSGIPPFASCVREAERRGIPAVGELDFAVPHIQGRIVGVTGSNGKSTVTALIGHILKKAGLKVGVGGNIGEAASLFTGEKFDCVVLELSSFQLHWVHELKTAAAIVTNLAPDHIDWHGSYEAYTAAKAKLLSLQDERGWGVIQACDRQALSPSRPDRLTVLSWDEASDDRAFGHVFMGKDRAVLRLGGKEYSLFSYGDAALLGRHNLENTAMALAVARLLNVTLPPAPDALEGFCSLPHRCELAGLAEGVTYIDDSKGTNVAASVTALTSIEGRKVVILGGKGKGEDYRPLAEAVLKEAEAAVVLGAEKERIEAALRNAGFTSIHRASGMEEAVFTAQRLARPGMVVLLSPACTSWDMYENYKKRGEHFRALVRELEG
ncbi:MAG: UDP-N-acetylmuramoyl-L-alanine--D-glutamate ligase [Synergistaceae bacterium]|jgi:UDP-N-acetylmuramoylalanine--D-glutamate ligase|nr:UDP-N-acetylmuramoyl-L-alanine--D-glutamate ligase [Synergistaceae bacterium]